MAPGVSSGKRSTKMTHARLFEGTSASQQVHSMGLNDRVKSATTWVDPRIDYSFPWFEDRGDGYYCHLCNAWATDGHVLSDKHKSRAQTPEWYGFGDAAQTAAAADSFGERYNRPWFENRDGEWYCLLCSAWATEGHVNSDRHQKRESYPECYGFQGPPRVDAGGPDSGGASCSGNLFQQDHAYNELLKEYTSKPWFEQREGEWYCTLCNAWATEGHLQGDKHQKRQMYPEWYGFDASAGGDPLQPGPLPAVERGASSKREESPLPAPWTKHFDDHYQRAYYHNPETEETTWEKPAPPAPPPEMVQTPPPPAPPQTPPLPVAPQEPVDEWSVHFDERYGCNYYHNKMTNTTQWQPPPWLSGSAAEDPMATSLPHAPMTVASPQEEVSWEKVWSEPHRDFFWHCKATGATQWEMPPGVEEEC